MRVNRHELIEVQIDELRPFDILDEGVMVQRTRHGLAGGLLEVEARAFRYVEEPAEMADGSSLLLRRIEWGERVPVDVKRGQTVRVLRVAPPRMEANETLIEKGAVPR